MNKHIKELWETKELACIGFIHSHPWYLKTPSGMDVSYFRSAFNWMPREKLLVPIVSTIPDGGFNLNPCFMFPKGRKFVQGTGINIIVEPHVSKYADLINPPRVITPVIAKPQVKEVINKIPKTDWIEGSDNMDSTNLIDYRTIVKNNVKQSKNFLINFFDYLLDGLFPNT